MAAPRPALIRATTDVGPRMLSPELSPQAPAEERWELRHGYDDEHNSEEFLAILNNVSYNEL